MTNFPISQHLPLERLVTDALGEIERLGYSKRSRNRYRAVWDHLIEFCNRKELGNEFSRDVAVRFLEEHRVSEEEIDKPGEGWRRNMGCQGTRRFCEERTHHETVRRSGGDPSRSGDAKYA